MKHLLISAVAAALVAGAFGLAAMQPAAAQPGGPPVCLSLAPGEHEISAPARDREGNVIFRVTVAEGGVVTEFVEPGGQSIPPVALLDIFTGADAYPLPDGVAIVECEAAGDSMASDDQGSGELCLNLEPGSYEESVSASGQTYNITIHVGENGRLTSVDVLGQSYSPSDALALLAQFGASIPPHIQILPCEPSAAAYPTTGTGGLADANSRTGLWASLATLAALGLVSAFALRRRLRRTRTVIR